MDLKNVCVVLARPEESRNVGAVCRAMANGGISDLRIVGERENYDEEKIRVLAIHAFPIWQTVRFYASITEATRDCTLSAGTTRRRGKNRKGKLFLPEEFADLAAKSRGKIAAVFGNERTGLSDDELVECTIGVTIPASADFASLNLSHAVQIICYTLFRETKHGMTGYTPLPLSRIDGCVSSIAESLKRIGFFKIAGRKDMERFWRSLLSRAAISEGEAQYIEKIFNKAAGLSTHRNINNY